MAEPIAQSSPASPTPPVDFDDTLGRAIDAGRLDPALAAADAHLAGAFAAHQKLESLFAALRGDPDPANICRERPLWRSADPLSLRERVRVRADGSDDDLPSRLGRYQIRSTLGAGAFGTVYLAHDPELNRDVAVKVSRAGAFASADVFDKFRAEARHAARLNHPHIVTIYDVGREGERVYIVMQYIAGQTLADAIAAGPFPSDRAAELLATVADALHYAHKLGFVHRDLKPANILLDNSLSFRERARVRADGVTGDPDHIGTPHIADFGLAVSDETQRLLAGQVAGTPAYMSPEQARGASHHLDGRADIWSLGVIGYELLTGRQPFWQGDVAACLDAIQHRDPKPPRQIDDTIPAELERIILKCLAKQPTDRYSTAGDLAADLRRWRKSREARVRRAFDKARANLSTVAKIGDTTRDGAVAPSNVPHKADGDDSVNAAKDNEVGDGHNAIGWEAALRWVAFAPAAVAASIATYFVVLVGNRLSLEFQFLNPDSVFGKLTCLTMSSVWPGVVLVSVASRVAPQHGKTVAVVVAGATLFVSGLAAYNVILDRDWWGAYQLAWLNVGSVGAACAEQRS